MCEDPAWIGLRGVNTTYSNDMANDYHVFCRGHRPSQFILKGDLCDNEFDCMDRSDESGCHGSSEEDEYTYDINEVLGGLKKIGRQPEISMIDLIYSEGGYQMPKKKCHPPSRPYSEVFPSRCPSANPKIPCNEAVEQIRIGEKCYPYHELCSNLDPQSPIYSHPDHIAFCQNFTFWGSKVEEDDKGYLVRPWTDETGEKIYACRGNFPGFNSYFWVSEKYKTFSEKKHHKPGCHLAYCPDLSDRICPASSSLCKSPKYFRCKDNSSCIAATLVCDGYVNCPDKSDEHQEYCGSCPLKYGDGHPRRLKSEKFANTFSCKHRYSETTICANLCDGRDDLCMGYEDENNCDEFAAGWTYFVSGIMITFVFSLILGLVEKCWNLINKCRMIAWNLKAGHQRKCGRRAKNQLALNKKLLYFVYPIMVTLSKSAKIILSMSFFNIKNNGILIFFFTKEYQFKRPKTIFFNFHF